MANFVKKSRGGEHFVKDFGGGSCSARIVLPGPDNARVKVTRFMPKAGFELEDIVYTCDETVHLVSGSVALTVSENETLLLQAGDVFFVPAGISYRISVTADSEAICVFSQGEDGAMPDNG